MTSAHAREPTPVALLVGQRIQDARNAAGLTQAQLAERLGTYQSTVARFEKGSRAPSLDTLFAIAEALSVPPSELVGRLLPAREFEPHQKK